MKRQIIYPGQIPLETDLLGAQKNTMIALSKLTAAIIGTATQVNGLACAPNSPAALNVVIAPGEIYSLQNIDGTAYSSIAADTAHSIMKQGILLDAVTLACAAPGTAGQSINYLIQAAFSEVDSGAVVLPYYNASNPSTAYSGPAGAGTTNNTVRDGTVVLSAKAGISAATGSQVTPAADAGYTGLYVVTVANGQTTITSGNISTLASAPIMSPATQSNTFRASLGPSGSYYYPNGMMLQWGLTTAITSGGSQTVTFPTTFPVACDRVFPTQISGAAIGSNSNAATGTPTPSGCAIYSYTNGGGSATYSYFAIGRWM